MLMLLQSLDFFNVVKVKHRFFLRKLKHLDAFCKGYMVLLTWNLCLLNLYLFFEALCILI